MNDLSMKRVGGALVILGVVTYVACFVWHLFVPTAFGGTLQAMLPGFDWTPLGFLIGLALVIVYSVYTRWSSCRPTTSLVGWTPRAELGARGSPHTDSSIAGPGISPVRRLIGQIVARDPPGPVDGLSEEPRSR